MLLANARANDLTFVILLRNSEGLSIGTIGLHPMYEICLRSPFKPNRND